MAPLTRSSGSSSRAKVFDGFLAATGRAGGFTKIWIVPIDSDGRATADATPMAFEAEACECGLASNKLFATEGKLRVQVIVPSGTGA